MKTGNVSVFKHPHLHVFCCLFVTIREPDWFVLEPSEVNNNATGNPTPTNKEEFVNADLGPVDLPLEIGDRDEDDDENDDDGDDVVESIFETLPIDDPDTRYAE